MRRSFLTIAILCAAIALPAVEETPVPKPEKPVKAAKAPALTVEDLPAAVRATAEAQAAGATIDKVRADERGGEKTYSVKFVREGVKTELRLNAEGKVVRMKAERGDDTSSVPTTSLPAAVQTAVASKLDGGKIVEIEEKMVKDAMVYQIEIATATGRVEIDIDADGKILSEKAKKAEEPKAKKEKKEKKDKTEVPAN